MSKIKEFLKNRKFEKTFRKNDDIIFKEQEFRRNQNLTDDELRKSREREHKAKQNIKINYFRNSKPKFVKNNTYNIENKNAVNQINNEATLFSKQNNKYYSSKFKKK